MEQSKPLVSIITPSFNQGQFIEDTILSIKNQTYQNIEHIVIDGGSTDQTVTILEKYSSCLTWISERDEGQTNAINKGIAQSHGEIIAYINSDDTYMPGTIKTIIDFFCAHPEIDMVYGDIIHMDKESKELETIKTGIIELEKYLTGVRYLPQPTVFFRKRVVESIGTFDENLNLAMDMDYWIRIFLTFKAAYIPKILAKARIYPEAKSSKFAEKYLVEKKYIIEKTFSDDTRNVKKFGSREKARTIKNKALGFVFFYGGMEFRNRNQLPTALSCILKGISLYPRNIFNPFLYWFLFRSLFGNNISQKIGHYLRKPDRLITYR